MYVSTGERQSNPLQIQQDEHNLIVTFNSLKLTAKPNKKLSTICA